MQVTTEVNGALEIFATIVAVILLIDNIISKGKDRQTAGLEQYTRISGNQFLQALLICVIISMVADAPTYFIAEKEQTALINMLMLIMYTAYFSALSLSTHYFACLLPITTSWGWKLAHATIPISFIGWAVWVLSIFNGMFGSVEGGEWIRAPLYFAGTIFGALVIIIDFILILSKRRDLSKGAFILFLSFVCIPAISALARTFGLQVLMPGFTIAIMLIYVFIDLTAAQERRRLETENTLAQTAILIGQIQPHFMYNAITAIRYLCIKDPYAARDALGDFAQFLRDNLEGLGNTKPVPIKREIEHVKAYVELEKLRFEDRIEVEYEISDEEIMLPAITLQPLVENAIKHGITKKVSGGKVIVSAWRSNSESIITIVDDGVGFDTSLMGQSVVKEGKRKSVGIENIRKRLEIICGGSMEIYSTPGEGTRVVVKLPYGGHSLIQV